jgi:hypothetical protein
MSTPNHNYPEHHTPYTQTKGKQNVTVQGVSTSNAQRYVILGFTPASRGRFTRLILQPYGVKHSDM